MTRLEQELQPGQKPAYSATDQQPSVTIRPF